MRSIGEINIKVDDSILCREFDTEVIDERKSSIERIKHVRGLFIDKIRRVQVLKTEDLTLEVNCKNLLKQKSSLLSDLKKVKSEKERVENVKRKLQDICRLLQKQNKEIADDNERISTIEQKRMAEVEEKFNASIADISSKLLEQESDQAKQVEENQQLREKVDQFKHHAGLKDEHCNTQLKAKGLELQLLDAKSAQIAGLIEHEKAKVNACKSHYSKMTESEKELRSQVELYAEKFESFDDAMSKSNDMFKLFKQRIEKMTSKIRKLSKQNTRLQKAILRNASDEESEKLAIPAVREELEVLRANKVKMEELCRPLQLERSEINKLLMTLPALPIVDVVTSAVGDIEEVIRSSGGGNSTSNNVVEDGEVKPPALGTILESGRGASLEEDEEDEEEEEDDDREKDHFSSDVIAEILDRAVAASSLIAATNSIS